MFDRPLYRIIVAMYVLRRKGITRLSVAMLNARLETSSIETSVLFYLGQDGLGVGCQTWLLRLLLSVIHYRKICRFHGWCGHVQVLDNAD